MFFFIFYFSGSSGPLDIIFISSYFLTLSSSSVRMNYSVEVLHVLPGEAFAII